MLFRSTPELCLEAVKQNGESLWCIQNQTSEVCLISALHNGNALEYIRQHTPEICLAAIRNTKEALQFVNRTCIFDDTPFKSFYYEQECDIFDKTLEERRQAWKALHMLNRYLPPLTDDCMRHICLRIS